MNRRQQTGEVFTPRALIREMLNALPNSVWFDPNKRWLEPAAGDGNFLVEIKARLLQAGHDEKHILDNMLFSIELIDDNHWVLQHRLGYLVDGQPNSKFWSPEEIGNWWEDGGGNKFKRGKIHQFAQDLNDRNPYHERLGLGKDQVLFHRNHVCTTALVYDMSFGREDGEELPRTLPKLRPRKLGAWPKKSSTPDIGEKYAVEQMLGHQPQLMNPDLPGNSEAKELSKYEPREVPSTPPADFVWLKGKFFIKSDQIYRYCKDGIQLSRKDIEAYPTLQLLTWFNEQFMVLDAAEYVKTIENTNQWKDKGGYSGGVPVKLRPLLREL